MKLRYSEVTPRHFYLNRRQFLSTAAIMTALPLKMTALPLKAAKLPNASKTSYNAGGERVTSYDIVTAYNNFYGIRYRQGSAGYAFTKFPCFPMDDSH